MKHRPGAVMVSLMAVLAWVLGAHLAPAQQTQKAPGKGPALEVTYYFLPG